MQQLMRVQTWTFPDARPAQVSALQELTADETSGGSEAAKKELISTIQKKSSAVRTLVFPRAHERHSLPYLLPRNFAFSSPEREPSHTFRVTEASQGAFFRVREGVPL